MRGMYTAGRPIWTAEGKVFVIRPSRFVDVGRLEKDPKKITELHGIGVSDMNSLWEALQAYLEK